MIKLGGVLGALVLLGVGRLLPAEGAGLYLRLAGATLVLLVPFAGAGASAALAGSMGALFVALAVTFAVHGSLTLTLVLYALAGLVALGVSRTTHRPYWSVLAVGVVLGIALWHVAGPVDGDALFHLARVRKLEAFDGLSLCAVDEFRDGGLHPGYAFPLWHGFLALLARLAGVDPALVVRHESSLLCPLALAVAFEAGRTLFRSRRLGLAVVLGSVGLFMLAPGNGGSYRSLDLPATASRQLLATAVLALAFAAVEAPGLRAWVKLAAAALALALVHPTYALFVLLPLVGWIAVRTLFERRDLGRLGGVLAAVGGPSLVVFAWLLPIARQTVSHSPGRQELHRAFNQYAGQLVVYSDSSYRLNAALPARSGAVAIAALALVPLAAFGARRRWGAFVLGGTIAVLAVMLVPQLFTLLSNGVSISQSRRAAGFVPFAFAFAGGLGVLATWLRASLLPLALAAGVGLQLAYPGDFGYLLGRGGPGAVTWWALGASAAAVGAAFLLRGRDLRHGRTTALAAALFVFPVAVHGFRHFSPPAAGKALSPGLVQALRTLVPARSVVFSDLDTSYRIAAFAPVYIAAAPPAHVADTVANRPYERADDVRRFLRSGSLAIPRRYDAGWIVVDRRHYRLRLRLPRVFADGRYTLYRLSSSGG